MAESISSLPSLPKRFGVLGTGRITRRLVADLQSTESVAVTAIASRDAQRARWYADQYGIAAAIGSYDELLDREDVDAVYVSLPPSLHAQWSIAAAERGKDVLCEKPLAVSAHEAWAIDAACRRAGTRWLDATGWLHHGRTAAFTQWIAGGRLGSLRHITASVSFNRPFQSGEHRLRADLGGGCLLDLGWYAAGLVRFAAGRLPESVAADAVQCQGVPYRVTAMMRFEDDLSATISCGYDTATRKWCEIAGSDASIVCDDFTRPWPDKPARCWIHEATGNVQQESFEGHQEREMIAALISPEPLAPLHAQALQTQHLLDALAESIRTRARVTLATHEPQP